MWDGGRRQLFNWPTVAKWEEKEKEEEEQILYEGNTWDFSSDNCCRFFTAHLSMQSKQDWGNWQLFRITVRANQWAAGCVYYTNYLLCTLLQKNWVLPGLVNLAQRVGVFSFEWGMDQVWTDYGWAMDRLWIGYEPAMDWLWIWYGPAMEQTWTGYGMDMDQVWIGYGSHMNQVWIRH